MTEKMNGHGDSVFVLIEEYYPKKESRQAVADIAIKSAGLVEGTKGLLMAETLLPKKEEDPVCSILTWETEADFNAFYSSDAIKELYKSEDMKTVQAGTEKVVTRKYSVGHGWHQ